MATQQTEAQSTWHGTEPPNYTAVFMARQARLIKLRQNPGGAREFYRTRPRDFINHWVTTFDPRLATGTLPAKLPFVMFPRQEEMVDFLHACLLGEANGLIEKCRDAGATWVCCAFSVWIWLYLPGAAVGWGSRKEDLVDRLGDPKCIFDKIRMAISALPREMLPKGFSPKDHMTFMKVINPENGATIAGEAGDNIGRGGRTLIYFKDESAWYERPERIEAALGDNTRVQIDISSVNGLGNVFHRSREAGVEWLGGDAVPGRTNVFVFDWRDHPAKTDAWHARRRQEAVNKGLLHIFEQEVNRNYAAAVEGIVIPADWVRAAIDADRKLGFSDNGGWCAALDVADEGGDTNALACRKGSVLKDLQEWGERDTGGTTRRAVAACRDLGILELQYDSIGIGAGVKAEANRLRDDDLLPRGLRLVPWSAGGEVVRPDAPVIDGDRDAPLNKDLYTNLKAQAWWELRRRFERTWRAVNEPDFTWSADDLISIPSALPLLRKLEKELSQATYSQGSRMRMVIDKAPPGTRSPNLADAVVMAFWPVKDTAGGMIDFMRTQAASVPSATGHQPWSFNQAASKVASVTLIPPVDVSTIYGASGQTYVADAYGIFTVSADDAPALRAQGFIDAAQAA